MNTELRKNFELGVYTFGNTPRTADAAYGATAQANRNALEAVRPAEDVGLDFFGFGEHHTRSMPVSSPTSLVIAAAAPTRRIKLGATVSVLSTDEPIRVFQQLATAAAIAPGRIEVVAGRGSSAITFSMFDLVNVITTCSSAQNWICCSRLIAKSASPGTARTADVLSRTCSWYPGQSSHCASGLAPVAVPSRCCVPPNSACRCSWGS